MSIKQFIYTKVNNRAFRTVCLLQLLKSLKIVEVDQSCDFVTVTLM